MRFYNLFLIILTFCISSCDNTVTSQNGIKKQNDTINQQPIKRPSVNKPLVDSIDFFFKSKGVLVFDAKDQNLKKSFKLLNDDNSVFATINIASDEIVIGNKKFSLSEFSNDNSLLNEYQFHPKEFYPDLSVIQFEYTNLNGNIAEVFIDKQKDIKMRIDLRQNVFKVQTWKEHLIGCMIDFNKKTNPIRTSNTDKSKSVGYENSREDYIFVISEISGDWIKIECAEICDYPCSSGKTFDGWIKWKDGNKLLIRLLYSC